MDKNYISAKELNELSAILTAIEKTLSTSGLRLGDVDVFDINEDRVAKITYITEDGKYAIESAYEEED